MTYDSWYMGTDALRGNGITVKLLYLLRDGRLTASDDPLNRVRNFRILIFVTVQLLGFGATFAITQTIGMSFRCALYTPGYVC